MTIATPPSLAEWVGELPEGPAGVLHVAAVWERADGEYETLRVGEGAPRALSDAVVLSGARACADAIVTTGRILRDEPDLVHGSIAPPEVTDELSAWRAALGLDAPPWILVLTGTGEVDLDHPALVAAECAILFTGEAGAARLREADVDGARPELVTSDSPSVERAIAHLREERGARTIAMEAGASTTRALYEGGGLVDALWLSTCRAPSLSEEDLVGPFVSRAAIESTLGEPVREERHVDGGLEWATRVHRRAAHRRA